VRADVIDLVDLRRIRVHAGLFVRAQGILVPGALPQLVGHVDVLFGDLVAQVVLDQLVVAEVSVGVVGETGDDVPAESSFGVVVECGDATGEVERQGLGDGAGSPGEVERPVVGGLGHELPFPHGANSTAPATTISMPSTATIHGQIWPTGRHEDSIMYVMPRNSSIVEPLEEPNLLGATLERHGGTHDSRMLAIDPPRQCGTPDRLA
jgi:hypothetical protein